METDEVIRSVQPVVKQKRRRAVRSPVAFRDLPPLRGTEVRRVLDRWTGSLIEMHELNVAMLSDVTARQGTAKERDLVYRFIKQLWKSVEEKIAKGDAKPFALPDE